MRQGQRDRGCAQRSATAGQGRATQQSLLRSICATHVASSSPASAGSPAHRLWIGRAETTLGASSPPLVAAATAAWARRTVSPSLRPPMCRPMAPLLLPSCSLARCACTRWLAPPLVTPAAGSACIERACDGLMESRMRQCATLGRAAAASRSARCRRRRARPRLHKAPLFTALIATGPAAAAAPALGSRWRPRAAACRR